MPIPAKMEITLKINTLPTEVTENKHGWKLFKLDAGGRIIEIALRPRLWNKLVEANQNWPKWLAAISGTMGQNAGNGFVLADSMVQVFERRVPPPDDGPPPPPPIPE